MFQRQRMFDARAADTAQVETSAAAQIERGDQWITPQLRLGITVPAHGVLAIAVMIEQYGIERLADLLHDTLANFVEQRCPGQRFVHFPGIAITRLGIAVPGGQPWRAVVTPMNEQFRLLPGRLLDQCVQPALGQGYELDAIAAVVIGGTSLSGGSGTILGTIIGAFIMSVLINGLRIMSVAQEWQMVLTGLIIILAVYTDNLRRRKG